MRQEWKFGDFRIRVEVLPSERGFLAGVMLTVQQPGRSRERMVYANHGVGNAFEFTNAKAAREHAFEVGHRAMRRMLARSTALAAWLPEDTRLSDRERQLVTGMFGDGPSDEVAQEP